LLACFIIGRGRREERREFYHFPSPRSFFFIVLSFPSSSFDTPSSPSFFLWKKEKPNEGRKTGTTTTN
jgi:hypothetical protein